MMFYALLLIAGLQTAVTVSADSGVYIVREDAKELVLLHREALVAYGSERTAHLSVYANGGLGDIRRLDMWVSFACGSHALRVNQLERFSSDGRATGTRNPAQGWVRFPDTSSDTATEAAVCSDTPDPKRRIRNTSQRAIIAAYQTMIDTGFTH